MGRTLLLARSFTPEELSIAVCAYDMTIAALGDPPLLVQEIVARQIIELMTEGEQDPDVLCERALTAAGIPSDQLHADQAAKRSGR
jgi:hypothetical protein